MENILMIGPDVDPMGAQLKAKMQGKSGYRLIGNEKRAVADAVSVLKVYWKDMYAPFKAIDDAIAPFGFKIEGKTISGDSGDVMVRIFNGGDEETGAEVVNAGIRVSWYKMGSGMYEVTAYLT